MKKKLWGYDVKEVDELVDSLQGQIEILNMKITKMAMELSAKGEALESQKHEVNSDEGAKQTELLETIDILKAEKLVLEKQMADMKQTSITDHSDNSARESEIADLNQLIDELKQEKYQLILRVESLTDELNEIESATCQQDKEELERLCRQACNEMNVMKENIMSEMQEYIEMFSQYSGTANSRIKESMEYIQKMQKELGEYLINTFESIVENLDTFTESSSEVREHLIPVEGLTEEFNQKIQLLEQKIKSAQETAEALISRKELTPRLSRLAEEVKEKDINTVAANRSHKIIESPIRTINNTDEKVKESYEKYSSDVS